LRSGSFLELGALVGWRHWTASRVVSLSLVFRAARAPRTLGGQG
jgi:hypothetical protein